MSLDPLPPIRFSGEELADRINTITEVLRNGGIPTNPGGGNPPPGPPVTSLSWTQVTDKPVTFPPSDHSHPPVNWEQIQGRPETFPIAAHQHTWSEIQGKPTTFAPAAHSHPMTRGTITASGALTNQHLAGNVLLQADNANLLTITVPAGLTGKEPVMILQRGVGRVTVVPATGVTINSVDNLYTSRTRFSSIGLVPGEAQDEYYLYGDLAEITEGEVEPPPVTNPEGVVVGSDAEPLDTDWETVQWAEVIRPGTVFVPPGATHAHVRFTLTRDPLATVGLAQMGLSNGTGTNVGPSSAWGSILPAYEPYWRPGDDLDLWVSLDLTTLGGKVHGNYFNFNVRPSGTGYGTNGDHAFGVRVEFQTGAVNTLPATMPRHRAPYQYSVTGSPAAALNVQTVTWSDSGYVGNATSGTGCLEAKLAHGYTQPGNGELGVYMNADRFPTTHQNPQQRITDSAGRTAIRLHTQRLPSPVGDPVHGGSYNFQASMVTTRRMPEFNARHGLWRAEVRTPSRRGAWSAFWSVGLHTSGGHRWPPEIDCFEHFNAGEYPSAASGGGGYTSGAVHYGNWGGNSRAGSIGIPRLNMRKMGFAQDVDLYNQIHEYAVYIAQNGFVYHFRDGIEVYCHYNAAVPQDSLLPFDWKYFWMFNVAVKPDSAAGGAAATYVDGNGDLDLYSFERFTGGQVTMSPFNDAKPWANRKKTPDPVVSSGEPTTPSNPGSTTFTAPVGYTTIQNYNIDRQLIRNFADPNMHIYLPSWEQGPRSVGDPNRITYNANGTVTLTAAEGPVHTSGRTWYTGSLQLHKPKVGGVGTLGALVHVTNSNAVAAVFGYANENGKEVDFELTLRNGVKGWAPNVHLPRASGGRTTPTSTRAKARAPLVDGPQLLEARYFNNRCEFYSDGVLFETLTLADYAGTDAIWDTTTEMETFICIEKHDSWAGWTQTDYNRGASMIVYAARPARP